MQFPNIMYDQVKYVNWGYILAGSYIKISEEA